MSAAQSFFSNKSPPPKKVNINFLLMASKLNKKKRFRQ